MHSDVCLQLRIPSVVFSSGQTLYYKTIDVLHCTCTCMSAKFVRIKKNTENFTDYQKKDEIINFTWGRGYKKLSINLRLKKADWLILSIRSVSTNQHA